MAVLRVKNRVHNWVRWGGRKALSNDISTSILGLMGPFIVLSKLCRRLAVARTISVHFVPQRRI